MLSMCIRWFSKRLYKRRRELLQAAFHKNGNNLYLHVMNGLELLTQPHSYNGDDYVPMAMHGKIAMATPTFKLLVQRLQFAINDHASMARGCEPEPFPEHLKKEKHPTLPRWLDLYFDTSSVEVLRQQLDGVRTTLLEYEYVYTQRNASQENEVLWNRTQHILRELEMIVEHYL